MDPPECSGHSHDHDHDDHLGLSLRQYVDFTGVKCLNEETPDSGKAVIKPHELRLTPHPSVQSPDDDAELLFYIPFTEAVTMQSITIRDGSSNSNTNATTTAAPRHVKLFTNRDDLDFDTARDLPAQMELELLPPDHLPEMGGTIDYPLRPAGRFQSISSISIFILDNYDDSGASGTEITHIGLKGKGTHMKRQAVDTVYESQGMLKDHQVPGGEFQGQMGV